MIELFHMGGMLFMSILTLLFIAVLISAFLYRSNSTADQKAWNRIKSIGLLALVVGVLGQMIGLYSAFEAIQQMGTVSPAMLAGGLKVSSITTMYGMVIYIISLVIWLIMGKLK